MPVPSVQQRQISSTGLVTSTQGDSPDVFAQVPVIWNGAQLEQQTGSLMLYNMNGRWYDPIQNRFISPGALSATSPNRYTLNGNNPLNVSSNVDWNAIKGDGAFSTWGSIGVGLADTVTFGLALSEDTRSQTNGGYFVGAAIGIAGTFWIGGAGFGALRGAYAGFSAARGATTALRLSAIVRGAGGVVPLAAAGYTLAGDVVGVYQSSRALVTGNFSPLDLLGFVPAIGWVAAWRRGVAPRSAFLSKLDDGIPMTGVSSLDTLAVESSSFERKLDAIRRMGYDVVADPKSLARGEFDIDARLFTYNPETMTRLDLAHEWRHYKQLTRLESAGLPFRSKISELAEVGAYRFEQQLWERIGAMPSPEYMQFHNSQLNTYLAGASSYRVQQFLRYHPGYTEALR